MLKTETKTDMRETASPLSLWCYCIERRARIINAVTRNNFHLQGQVPHTKMTGQPCDISDICEFDWFKWCMYRIEGRKYPFQSERLGRVLGVAEHKGSAMSQWILTETGNVLPIQTLRSLTPAELN